MSLSKIDSPPKPKSVAEQQSNFTAEGAPPPGKVVGSVVPVTPDDEVTQPPTSAKGSKKSVLEENSKLKAS